MQFIKLNSLTLRLTRTKLIQRFISSHSEVKSVKNSIETSSNIDENDEPIPYSASAAAEWKVEYSQRGTKEQDPVYQPYIVGLSAIIFLLYFTILRESNDIDEILGMELGDHFPNFDPTTLQGKNTFPPKQDPKTYFK